MSQIDTSSYKRFGPEGTQTPRRWACNLNPSGQEGGGYALDRIVWTGPMPFTAARLTRKGSSANIRLKIPWEVGGVSPQGGTLKSRRPSGRAPEDPDDAARALGPYQDETCREGPYKPPRESRALSATTDAYPRPLAELSRWAAKTPSA